MVPMNLKIYVFPYLGVITVHLQIKILITQCKLKSQQNKQVSIYEVKAECDNLKMHVYCAYLFDCLVVNPTIIISYMSRVSPARNFGDRFPNFLFGVWGYAFPRKIFEMNCACQVF